MFEGFKLKYRLNAKHSFSNDVKNIHPHTFEISLLFEQLQPEKRIALYSSIDRIVENFLLRYQNQYLNDISPFNQLEPSIENMGDVFYEELKVIFYNEKLNLIQLEISETPLRVYLVSDRLMFSSINLT
jgi:6-pyruvoyl tetrahydropterin synthase-like protein